MSQAALTSKLGRLADALVPKVQHLEAVLEGETFLQHNLHAALDACSDALLDLETFLTPVFVTTAGLRYTPPERTALAKLTSSMMSSTLPSLANSLLAALDDDGGCISEQADCQPQPASPTSLCIRVNTILSRIFVIMLSTLQNLEPGRSASEYIALLHTANILPACCNAFFECNDNLKTIMPNSASLLPTQDDRFRVYLCGALLGCTLSQYTDAASRVAALAREGADKSAKKRKVSSQEGAGMNRTPLWTQMQLPACDIAAHQVTWLLAQIVQDCTFYQCQSLLHQTLIFPSLRLEHLVSDLPGCSKGI